MIPWMYEVTTRLPQYEGQTPDFDLLARPYYRQVYATKEAAQEVSARLPARVWVFQPGMATGGEMLLDSLSRESSGEGSR